MVPTRRETGDEIVMRAQCPTHRLMGVIGDRWSVLVLIALHDGGETRTADLRRAVEGVSQKMLTQTLRRLQDHDLVSRAVEATVPVSVSYTLTDRGRGLCAALAPLRAWAETHVDDLRRD
ncbi:winged helix-turn-helix transcriptional regulator [Pseudonocardia abyssalis]|nr:helix-turn-helix domain-containing protein [Pseudonocardia abyssalis]